MTNPETPSTALKRLIELEDAASTNGADPDTTVWDDAVAAGRAALKAEPEGPSLADIRQLCVDNELLMFVHAADFDTVVVAILEIVRTALSRWGNLVTSPATELGVDKWYPDFADWLEREMPEGTVIGDPLWWASKIADRIICTPALLQQVSTPTAPEPKRVEGVGELVEELRLMANRAADARQFGDAHFLSRAVALLQQLQTEQI